MLAAVRQLLWQSPHTCRSLAQPTCQNREAQTCLYYLYFAHSEQLLLQLQSHSKERDKYSRRRGITLLLQSHR
jgi:hypothetical protein